MAKILKEGKVYVTDSMTEYANAYLVIDDIVAKKGKVNTSEVIVYIYKDQATRELAKTNHAIQPIWTSAYRFNETILSWADAYAKISEILGKVPAENPEDEPVDKLVFEDFEDDE